MLKKIEKPKMAFTRYFMEADDTEDQVSVKVAPRKNRGNDYSDDTTSVKVAPHQRRGTDYSADDATEETPTAPDTGDGGTDYSSSDASGDEGDNSGDTGESMDDSSNENTEEKEKKFNMYKRYLNLYNMIENFLEKLRDVVKDNPSENAVIKTVTNNLNDLHDNMYDFMTIRFKDESYVQILVYFETVISVIQLNFELLRNNRIKLKQ